MFAVICLSWYYIWICINLYTFYLSYRFIELESFLSDLRLFCSTFFRRDFSRSSFYPCARVASMIGAGADAYIDVFVRFFIWFSFSHFIFAKANCHIYLHRANSIGTNLNGRMSSFVGVSICVLLSMRWHRLSLSYSISISVRAVCELHHIAFIKFWYGTFFRLSIKYINRLSVKWHLNWSNIAFIGCVWCLYLVQVAIKIISN